jgi:hypothetical protein
LEPSVPPDRSSDGTYPADNCSDASTNFSSGARRRLRATLIRSASLPDPATSFANSRYFLRFAQETRIHKWDQEFESAFLQRRVLCELDSSPALPHSMQPRTRLAAREHPVPSTPARKARRQLDHPPDIGKTLAAANKVTIRTSLKNRCRVRSRQLCRRQSNSRPAALPAARVQGLVRSRQASQSARSSHHHLTAYTGLADGTESLRTRRWRKPDSNSWSRQPSSARRPPYRSPCFAQDSPLEGAGFEPSVPRRTTFFGDRRGSRRRQTGPVARTGF